MPPSRFGPEWGYFEWLYSQIGAVTDRNPSHSRWLLAEQLHRKEFQWFIPNDDNRLADGLELREEFGFDDNSPCSMLEMLIALARRTEYEAGGRRTDTSTGEWFWRLLSNVHLRKYNDERYSGDDNTHEDVDVILETIIHRRYRKDGHGGLFPLQHADQDQRKVELWYQLAAYLLENHYY